MEDNTEQMIEPGGSIISVLQFYATILYLITNFVLRAKSMLV